MNRGASETLKLTRLLVGRTVLVRVLDCADIREVLRGRVVRILHEDSFHFPVSGKNRPPFAVLVDLECDLSVSPHPDQPVKSFEYALLVAWDYDELVALSSSTLLKETSSIHFYLLEEDKLARIHVSPERDDLDYRWTYGISKWTEIAFEG